MADTIKFVNDLGYRRRSLKSSKKAESLIKLAKDICSEPSSSFSLYNKYSSLRDIQFRIRDLTGKEDIAIKEVVDRYWNEFSKLEDQKCIEANQKSFSKYIDEIKRKGLLSEIKPNVEVSCKVRGKRNRICGKLNINSGGELTIYSNGIYNLGYVGKVYDWNYKGQFGERFAQAVLRNGIKVY